MYTSRSCVVLQPMATMRVMPAGVLHSMHYIPSCRRAADSVDTARLHEILRLATRLQPGGRNLWALRSVSLRIRIRIRGIATLHPSK